MTSADIEQVSNDNGRSHFRSQRVKISGRGLATPAKALEPTRLFGTSGFDTSPFQFVEGFRTLDPEGLAECMKSANALEEANAKLRQQCAKGPPGAARLAFVNYRLGSPLQWPKKAEVELLTDLAYANSDIVPIPIPDSPIALSQIPRFRTYIGDAFTAIERLNNKPVMGLLPTKMPREGIRSLLKWYGERGVNCFCVDFAGMMPDHLKVRSFTAQLAELEMLTGSLLYGINARAGKFVKAANAIPARDFFVYGLGLDVLGGSHKASMVPPAARGKRRRASHRVFSAATYGYHKLETASQGLPIAGPFKPETILSDPSGRVGRLYNMEAQRKESGALASRLGKLDKKGTILSYVKQKALAVPELDHFRKERTLD